MAPSRVAEFQASRSEGAVQAHVHAARRIGGSNNSSTHLSVAGGGAGHKLGGVVPIDGCPDGKNVGANLGHFKNANGHNVHVGPGFSVPGRNAEDQARFDTAAAGDA